MNCLSLVREANQVAKHQLDARDNLEKVSACRAPKRDLFAVHVRNFYSHRLLAQCALPTAAFHQCEVGIRHRELDGDEDCKDSWKTIGDERCRGFRWLP